MQCNFKCGCFWAQSASTHPTHLSSTSLSFFLSPVTYLCLLLPLSRCHFSICPLTEQSLCSHSKLISLNASLCIKRRQCLSQVTETGRGGGCFTSLASICLQCPSTCVIVGSLPLLDSTWPNEIISALPPSEAGPGSVAFFWSIFSGWSPLALLAECYASPAQDVNKHCSWNVTGCGFIILVFCFRRLSFSNN